MNHCSFYRFPFALVVVLGLAAPSFAADATAEAAAKEQITARNKAVIKAFDDHDAKALAAFYTEQGEIVMASGTSFSGRDAVEQAANEGFNGIFKDATLVDRIEKVRLVGTNVAIVDSDLRFKTPGNDADEAAHFHAITILSLHDGKWMTESLRMVKYAGE